MLKTYNYSAATGTITHNVRNINAKIMIGFGASANATPTASLSFDNGVNFFGVLNVTGSAQTIPSGGGALQLYMYPGITNINFTINSQVSIQVIEYYEPGTQ